MPATPTSCTRRHASIALVALLALPRAASAALPVPPEVAAELETPRLYGQGRFHYFGMHVYDIRLWVGEGFRPAALDEMPLALELEYARRLEGAAIAERSLTEMQRNQPVTPQRAGQWLDAMRSVFPDVAPGDRLTGSRQPVQFARFFHNGQARGEVRDAAFARAFFGIWLAPTSSEPRLRRALLGETP